MAKRRDFRCVFWLDGRKERAFYILVLFLGFWRLGVGCVCSFKLMEKGWNFPVFFGFALGVLVFLLGVFDFVLGVCSEVVVQR